MSLSSPTVPSPLTLSTELTQSQGSDGYGTDLIEMEMDQVEVCVCVWVCGCVGGCVGVVFEAVASAETSLVTCCCPSRCLIGR